MPQRNTIKFTYLNSENITAIIYKSRFLIATIFALLLLASSCKKSKPPEFVENVAQNIFETNILNSNFIVKKAVDSAVDITSQFTDYRFILYKNTNFEGPMKATRVSNPSVVYTGTWSTNEDYSKLVISITQSTIPAEFNFLNRPWKFTKKGLPVMELAPWGTVDPKVLHMERL